MECTRTHDTVGRRAGSCTGSSACASIYDSTDAVGTVLFGSGRTDGTAEAHAQTRRVLCNGGASETTLQTSADVVRFFVRPDRGRKLPQAAPSSGSMLPAAFDVSGGMPASQPLLSPPSGMLALSAFRPPPRALPVEDPWARGAHSMLVSHKGPSKQSVFTTAVGGA